MSPQIQCLGLSHKTAEVSLREKLNNLEHELLYQASSLPGSAPIDEIAVVSTCNRIEIYVVSEAKAFGLLKRLILNNCDVGAEELEQSKYSLTGLQVASHLLRVSAGLDSMVLGEPQILGQVTEAYERALQAGTVGKILSRLFQISIHAGKRVHTETHIGREAVSIPSVAAGLVNQHYKNLDDVRITLLGAGEMADLAVEALRKRGATRLHIVSRTLASACKLADRWEGQASTFDALTEVLRGTNVLITSSSAPHFLIDRSMIENVMRCRPDTPLVIIDIAVPRDVEPSVGEVPKVHLFDIDALNQDVDESLASRRKAIPHVEAILAEEYLSFKKFIDSLTVVPLIVDLREYTEAIREDELQKTLKGLGEISAEQGERIRFLTESIVKKILHQPTKNLHQVSSNGDAQHYVTVLREIFGLDPGSDFGPRERENQ